MKKQMIVICMLAAVVRSVGYEDWIHRAPGEHDIILESSLVKLVDGLSFGIDGRKIAMMFKVRKEVRKIQHGVPVNTGAVVGKYPFRQVTYGVHDLALM